MLMKISAKLLPEIQQDLHSKGYIIFEVMHFNKKWIVLDYDRFNVKFLKNSVQVERISENQFRKTGYR